MPKSAIPRYKLVGLEPKGDSEKTGSVRSDLNLSGPGVANNAG